MPPSLPEKLQSLNIHYIRKGVMCFNSSAILQGGPHTQELLGIQFMCVCVWRERECEVGWCAEEGGGCVCERSWGEYDQITLQDICKELINVFLNPLQ